jgi:cytoskeleton protein RodZ
MIPQQLTELGDLPSQMSNFGASFRKARESSGLPLDRIAADTRISSRFLTAIENEDFHLLPGGVFNRGFIRAYAERVGIDPDQALADYDRLSIAVEEPVEELRNVERASMRRSERNLYPIAAGILALLVVVFYFVTRNSATGSASETPAPAAVAKSAPPVTAPEPPPIEEPAAPTTAEAQAPATVQTPAPVSTPPATTPPARTAPPATPATGALVLDVTVKELTWMKIATDGNIIVSDNLPAGTTQHVTATTKIDITIGNAGGASLKINGRDVPTLGQTGVVRELSITPENASTIR